MVSLVIILISITILVYMYEPFARMYYMTVATKSHPVLEKIKDKILLEGQTLHIRGLEENRDIGWKGKGNFGIKLREVYTFLQQSHLNSKDIVLFTDAFDVALVRPQKEIMKRYKEFHTPIVFGAEKGCHPDKERAGEYTRTQGEPFPYLNSGLFIGRVWALRKCMEGYSYEDKEDDQRYWTNKYFQYPELITLDTKAKLFLNCAFVDKKYMEYDRFEQKLVYRETGTQPMVIHANGHDKSYLHVVIERWQEP